MCGCLEKVQPEYFLASNCQNRNVCLNSAILSIDKPVIGKTCIKKFPSKVAKECAPLNLEIHAAQHVQLFKLLTLGIYKLACLSS